MRSRHLALLPACLVLGCAEPAPEPPPSIRSDLPRDLDPDVTASEVEALVAGNTAFAADLYRVVRGEPGNLFFSPHSISTALAMTYVGAEGNTEAEMAATLHFTLPEPTLHAALSHLDLELASRATAADSDTRPFRLSTANSIWGQQGRAFLPGFLDTLAVHYGTGLNVLDFTGDPDGSRQIINAWVASVTDDKIVDLLPERSITELTRLVLTNAIYFSAAWEFPFEVADTAARPFTTPTGAVDVPTLRQGAELGYGAGPRFRAAELPYDGYQLSMVVVVPELLPGETGDPLALLEADLTADKLGEIRASLGTASVTLTLPKFRYDAPLSLEDTLTELGMVDAFDGAVADFSGLDGTRLLAISDVIHKGFVGIDEAGTEAAAATAVIAGDTSAPEPQTLTVDRPFLFFIVDRPTGAILFIGRVVDPR